MIYRVRKSKDFTQIANNLLRDKRLSFKARGLVAMVLSHGDQWNVTRQWLIDQGPDGQTAVQSALSELKKFGYLRIEKQRDAGGKVLQHVWVWSESPAGKEQKPEVENPAGGEPAAGKNRHSEDYSSEDHLQRTLSESAREAGETNGNRSPTAIDIVASWVNGQRDPEAVKIVQSQIEDGEDPEEILSRTQAVARIISDAGARNNRYAPKALKFFGSKQWADTDDYWRERFAPPEGQPNGSDDDGPRFSHPEGF